MKIDLTTGQRNMQTKLLKKGVLTQKDLDEMINNGLERHGAELRNDIDFDVSMDYTHLNIDDEMCDLVLFDPPFKISGAIDENENLTISYLKMRNEMRTRAGNPRDFVAKFGAYHSKEERLEEYKRAFLEIHRILKPDGICIFKWDTKIIPLNKLPLNTLVNIHRIKICSKWSRMHKSKCSWFFFLQRAKKGGQ